MRWHEERGIPVSVAVKSHLRRAKILAEQRLAADCLQPPLLRRSGFRQQLKAGVRTRKPSSP
jgi:hypothetical protein